MATLERMCKIFHTIYDGLLKNAEKNYSSQNLSHDELKRLFNLLNEARDYADFFQANGALSPSRSDSDLSKMLWAWSRHRDMDMDESTAYRAKEAPSLGNMTGANLWLKFVSPSLHLHGEEDQRVLALQLIEEMSSSLTDVFIQASFGPPLGLTAVFGAMEPSVRRWKAEIDPIRRYVSRDPQGGTIVVNKSDVDRVEKVLVDSEGLEVGGASLEALAGAMSLPHFPGDHIAVILQKRSAT